MKNSKNTQLGALAAAALALAMLGSGCTLPGVYHTGQRNPAAQNQARPQPEISQPAAPPPPAPAAAPETPAVAAQDETPVPESVAVVEPPPPPLPDTSAPPPETPAPEISAPLPPSAPDATAAASQTPPPPAAQAAAAPAPVNVSLQDTVWQLATLNGAPIQAPAPSTIIMLDSKRNSLLGMSGDMKFRAQYETAAASLHFSQIATNQQNDSITPLGTAMLRALSQTGSWRINDHTLSLLNQNGGILATFIVAGK